MDILGPDTIGMSIVTTQTTTSPSVLTSHVFSRGFRLKPTKNVTEVSKNRNSEESALPSKSMLEVF